MYSFFYNIGIAVSYRLCDHNVSTERNTYKGVYDKPDDRTVRAHRSHSGFSAVACEITHHRHIRGVKKLLQNSRCGNRQGISKNFIPQRAVGYICGMYSRSQNKDLFPLIFANYIIILLESKVNI